MEFNAFKNYVKAEIEKTSQILLELNKKSLELHSIPPAEEGESDPLKRYCTRLINDEGDTFHYTLKTAMKLEILGRVLSIMEFDEMATTKEWIIKSDEITTTKKWIYNILYHLNNVGLFAPEGKNPRSNQIAAIRAQEASNFAGDMLRELKHE